MKDLEFIRQIKDMKSPREICLENNIDYPNLINGRLKNDKEKKVANLLKKQIIEMYDLIIFSDIIEDLGKNENE